MKLLSAFIAEFILFLLVDALGGVFYHPFHLVSTLTGKQLETRSFVWDGVLMMVAMWVLLLILGAIRRRFSSWAALATAAMVSASIAGLLLKIGFITRNW